MAKNKEAAALISACQKSLAKNENNLRTIKGVCCSHSDVETALLYAETIASHGSYTGRLMQPRGAVGELLDKFMLREEC